MRLVRDHVEFTIGAVLYALATSARHSNESGAGPMTHRTVCVLGKACHIQMRPIGKHNAAFFHFKEYLPTRYGRVSVQFQTGVFPIQLEPKIACFLSLGKTDKFGVLEDYGVVGRKGEVLSEMKSLVLQSARIVYRIISMAQQVNLVLPLHNWCPKPPFPGT